MLCIPSNELILDRISVLRMQEQSAYEKSPPTDHAHINFDHRSAMVIWWLNLLEILEYPTEIAEIALSYLDRCLCSTAGSSMAQNLSSFRLLCVTCIYTAIKVHGYASVPPSSFAQLCQDEYTVEQIEEMEYKLLPALQWRMNPPTGRSYLRLFVELLPSVEDDKQIVLELADYQVVHSTPNEKWMTVASYVTAYCAFINALETVGMDQTMIVSLQQTLRFSLEIDCEKEDAFRKDLQSLVLASTNTLEKAYSSSNDDKSIDLGSKASKKCAISSPRSVLYQEESP
ncbi:hypothetical protein FisN_14Hu299 [Fistulifera solaris]|uniref:Cyclin-like domain-containing protein n=1 Tax=Fistulifera solaris TaxID=1519565 RepID=A0A1Z5KBE5_FISSO|nr:hypothetical protein FisN_14Hu299 [Fistulifera solaris]|eukprot:GAX23526.1 hypothetical protein FisN_14Hu299 [Fistulifera solaris]